MTIYLVNFITHPIFYISFIISWILCSVLKMKTPKQKHKLKLIWYSFSYENRNFCFFLFLLLVSLAYDFQKMHMFFLAKLQYLCTWWSHVSIFWLWYKVREKLKNPNIFTLDPTRDYKHNRVHTFTQLGDSMTVSSRSNGSLFIEIKQAQRCRFQTLNQSKEWQSDCTQRFYIWFIHNFYANDHTK
jgi:hypothetical protein